MILGLQPKSDFSTNFMSSVTKQKPQGWLIYPPQKGAIKKNRAPKGCTCFGSTYTKIGTIQRRLAWPLRKDDTQNHEAFHIFVPQIFSI